VVSRRDPQCSDRSPLMLIVDRMLSRVGVSCHRT